MDRDHILYDLIPLAGSQAQSYDAHGREDRVSRTSRLSALASRGLFSAAVGNKIGNY